MYLLPHWWIPLKSEAFSEAAFAWAHTFGVHASPLSLQFALLEFGGVVQMADCFFLQFEKMCLNTIIFPDKMSTIN